MGYGCYMNLSWGDSEGAAEEEAMVRWRQERKRRHTGGRVDSMSRCACRRLSLNKRWEQVDNEIYTAHYQHQHQHQRRRRR
jgi:hypothetical protein